MWPDAFPGIHKTQSREDIGYFMLETVESGLISNKINFDGEQETLVDTYFIYSPSVLPAIALLDNISPE